MNKINLKANIYIIISFIIFTFSPLTTQRSLAAEQSYKLLSPIGELTQVSRGSFSSYLQTMVNIAIGLVGAVSVIMLIVGGLQYILTSVNEGAKKEAKERITNAIIGILIILSGYLILNTINPDLLKLDFPKINRAPKITPQDASAPPSFSGSADISDCVARGIKSSGPDGGALIADNCNRDPNSYSE